MDYRDCECSVAERNDLLAHRASIVVESHVNSLCFSTILVNEKHFIAIGSDPQPSAAVLSDIVKLKNRKLPVTDIFKPVSYKP